jgi:hypothetical protein
MDIKLIKGNRYLFHNQETQSNFRANFVKIITRDDGYKTLIVEKYVYESGQELKSEIVTMPFSWINKIETLVDILNTNSNNITYNQDILLEIDSFL